MRGPAAMPSLGRLRSPNGGCGLLAGNPAIETHHGGDPVVDRVVARIAFPHCQLADLDNLNRRLLRATLQLGGCRKTVDDFRQAANSPCSFNDSGPHCARPATRGHREARDRQDRRLRQQDLLTPRLLSSRRAFLETSSSLSRILDGAIRVGRLLASRYQRAACFEQIFMLRDLPDVHADGSGDLFEIRLLVCGERTNRCFHWCMVDQGSRALSQSVTVPWHEGSAPRLAKISWLPSDTSSESRTCIA